MSKKTTTDDGSPEKSRGQELGAGQLELALQVRTATIVQLSQLKRTPTRQSEDAERRLMEFAASLPDW